MLLILYALIAQLLGSFCGVNLPAINPFGSDTDAVVAAPVVLTEMFTGELIKKFRFAGKWLALIPSEDKYVYNNVIHLNDVGADPTVLINNTTYPIGTSSRDDEDIAISLYKYDTTNTKISDDELYALSYDKIGSVVEQHKDVLEERTAEHGLHSLCPSADSATTPVILTTGGTNGNGRKRMLISDVIALKKRLDDLKVPRGLNERILVLCNDHVNDLLLDTSEEQSFRDRYFNTKTGEPIDFLGFTIFEDAYCPVFNASNTKKAFGAAAAGSDQNASTLIIRSRAFKSKGTLKMYYTPSELETKNRETVAGFRLYHVVLPKKNTGFGAIISAPSA